LMGTREVVIRAFERERAPARPAQLGPDIVAEAGRALLSGLNREFGGFGAAPRLPTPHALQLAALLYRRGGGNVFLDAMVRTLDGMERGAIHDRIGGGFHRSTSDPAWRIPQFEKLAHFNASLVEAYLTGFQATGRDEYLQVAGGTVDYLLTTLRDPAGCFYFAQAPAASFDEPRGAYYTWSEPDFRAAIPAGLEKVAATLFNIKPEGEILLGPPARSTLYRTMPVDEAAQRLGMDAKAARQAEAAIVAALKRARESRAAPPIDRTIYVDSCAAAARAMLEASVLLDRPEARNAGLQAVDRMLAAAEGGPLRHRLQPPPDPDVDPVLAMDHIMLARASVAAFEQTGQERYLTAARELVDKAVTLFWDGESGGFFDVVADPNARGYLSIRRRLPNDTAFPSLNSTASRLLNRIWQHTGESSYRARAEQALANQVSTTRKLDQHDAGLGLAVELHRHPPTRYVIVGREEDDKVAALEAAALKIFDPDRVVVVLRPGKDDDRIRALRVDRPRGAWAAVCSGESCKGPVRDPEALAAAAGIPQPDAPPPFEGN
ncbi:MAG TPA: hypothetical protein VFP98_02420, partial [Candidatus Polarisedimenticolia bacterium]|nr:hypothetical protein [Candidatus Polarisedimenticolia bacterium]